MRTIIILVFICTSFVGKTISQESVPALSPKQIELVKQHYKPEGKQDVKTYLFSDQKEIKKGERVKVGILFEIKPGMNIYGPEKSSSNLPTVVEWKLPEGVTLERVVWQKTGALAGGKKGYVGYCFVMAEIKIDPDYQSTTVEISVATSFQACDENYCTPGETRNDLSVIIGKSKRSAVEKLFKKH